MLMFPDFDVLEARLPCVYYCNVVFKIGYDYL